jgi:hypothetical protein
MLKDICASSLVTLSQLNINTFNSEYKLDITSGREYGPLKLISGHVNIPIHFSTNQVFDSSCFTVGCFDSSGIWSTKPISYKRELSNCLIEGYETCFEEYEAVCSVQVPYSEHIVYEPDVFDLGIYQLHNGYRTEYRSGLCYEPPVIETPFHPLQELFDINIFPTTSSICNKFTLNKDYNLSIDTYDADVFEEGVYTTCDYEFESGTELVVCLNGPYEPGIYDDCTYNKTFHVSFYNPSKCLDECVISPLEPIAAYGSTPSGLTLHEAYNCESSFPSSRTYQTAEGKNLLILEDTCIDSYCQEDGLYEKRLFYYDLDTRPYVDEAFEEGVYVDKCLTSSHQIETIFNPNFCCLTKDDLYPLAYLSAQLNEFLHINNLAPNSEYYPHTTTERKEIVDCSSCYIPLVKSIEGVDRLTRFNGYQEEVFFNGLPTPLGALVVDIGYIYPGTYEFVLLKKDVPVSNDGTFSSEVIAPNGIKAVRLKAITRNREVVLGMSFGDNPLSPLLIKTYSENTPLSFPTNHVVLEDLAITLILISLSGYKSSSDNCPTNNMGMYYLEPYIKALLENNLTKLATLINRNINSPTFNGIPSSVYPDSTYESLYERKEVDKSCYVEGIYKAECDLMYDDPTMIGDDFLCLTECFSKEEDITPILPLDTDLRSIAWLIISYTTYLDTFPKSVLEEEYTTAATTLGEHLMSRLTPFLIDEGNETSRTSTNIMACLAFIKLYELTANPTYLNRAADLYISINDYLYSFLDKSFIHEASTPVFSAEATIYGLIFSLWTNQDDKVEALLRIMKLRRKSFRDVYRVAITNEEGLITDLEGSPILIHQSDSYELIKDGYFDLLIPFYTAPQEAGYSLADTVRLMILADYVLKATESKGFNIGFSNHIDIYQEEVRSNPKLQTSTWLASCLTDIFIHHSLITPSSLKDLQTLIFNREYVTDQLKKMIPTGFGWFHKNALGKQSNLGRMLRSFAYGLSSFYPALNSVAMSFSLTGSKHFNVDKWEEELKMPRWDGESLPTYKARVRDYLLNKTIDRIGIQNLFNLYDIDLLDISDITLQSFDSYTQTQSSLNSIIRDSNLLVASEVRDNFIANVPTVFITTNKPVLDVIANEVSRLTPVGVMVRYIEKVDYLSCSRSIDMDRKASSLEIAVPSTAPGVLVEPLCCTEEAICGPITYRVRLQHVSGSPLYLYREGDSFYVSESSQEGDPLTMIPPYTANKLFLYKP